ncbi:MAG: MATE family efflux transporter [Planctomycetes bacterium]|jgi:putative MATE family efflux protein|nr:MATE family efflux transporter [Planctomycetota bacterium]
MLLHAAYRVNDQFWIQDLGAPAQAAMGVTAFYLILNFGFINVVSAGALARIARFTGSGEVAKRDITFRTTMWVGLGWFLTVGALGWMASPWLVAAAGSQGEVATFANDYLSTIYLVLPLIALKPVVDVVFLGLGNTFLPMILAACAVGINFALNPILIYGWGPIPALGIAGAAWATGFSKGLSGGVGLWLLWRKWKMSPSRLGVGLHETKRIAAIGAPVGLFAGSYAIIFLILLKTSIEPLGQSVQAGLGVAFNGVESLAYCGLMGPATAASSMVGRALGAKQWHYARQAMRACWAMSALVAGVFTILFLTSSEWLSSLYTNDPAVQQEAARYLWIVAFGQVITATDAVMQQAMTGAGRTLKMSLLNTAGFAIRIPLAWALSGPLGWGAAGIWWALNIANTAKLAAMVALFRKMQIFRPHP